MADHTVSILTLHMVDTCTDHYFHQYYLEGFSTAGVAVGSSCMLQCMAGNGHVMIKVDLPKMVPPVEIF